jgi:tetratricopeptide (TPR) repeat protein
VIVATECPWRGKILAPDEYAELTDEEMASSLVRAGFGAIERHVDGPFFRLWSARLEPGSAHELLSRASAMLEKKDPAAAEEVLSNLHEPLSPDGVREYGLLVAACHDMAGRAEQAMAALSQILEIDPGCARALCGLGRLAALGGELNTARALFEQALSGQPALVAALRGKSAVAEALGDLQEAYSAVLTASDLRPTDDQLLVETVRLGRACGKQAHIERFLRNLESRRPLSPMVSALLD